MVTSANMGLTVWDSLNDRFNHDELADNFTAIDEHDHSTGKGVQVPTGGIANSAVTEPKLGAAAVNVDKLHANVASMLGVSANGVVARGKAIIATEESRTNTAFGLLTTPDRVQNIVLGTDGLICVAYQALWKSDVASAGAASIFVGANQVKMSGNNNTYPLAFNNTTGTTVNTYGALASDPRYGLIGANGATATGSHVTTGQLVSASTTTLAHGGVAVIFAAAGTYDVSIQYKASSGTVTAKERKLWVWTLGF